MARPAPAVPDADRPWDHPARMLGVDEARARILAAFAPLPSVELPLPEAQGLVLAADVRAGADVPAFPNSAMDGYALRAADTAGAAADRPVALRVVGEAPAGRPSAAAVGPGTAVRIMTGAPLPDGADAVVRFEETDEATRLGPAGTRPGTVAIRRPARPGDHVRPAGEDLRAGETALAAGTRLRPAHLGLLAALGRSAVAVHRRPQVAVLATGDELVGPGAEPGPGQIFDCNGPLVAALVRRCGGEPLPLGIARDARADLRAKLRSAADADLLVTSGGVSVGDYDLVKAVLREEGRVDLWQVRIKPGKPLAFGHLGGRPLVGLPGNPVAAAVAFEQFVRPAILRLLGRADADLAPPTVPARLAERVENRGGRRHFVRVRLEPEAEPEAGADGWVARPVGPGGAGVLSALARADGLLVVPEDLPVAEAGSVLPVQVPDWEIG